MTSAFPQLEHPYEWMDPREHTQGYMGRIAVDLVIPRDKEKAERIDAAGGSLIKFIQYTFPRYKADPFHEHMAGGLDNVVQGVEGWDRVMLFAPPQHGKSTAVSTYLPPYWLGHNPDLPVALVSYGGRLADRNSRLAQSVMLHDDYVKIFKWQGVRADRSNWRVYDWHVAGFEGYVLAVGVGGAITGHGFGLIIIDDPIENWAAAQSEIIRESTWDWWLGTIKTRIWEHGRIILMMTRWHKDDLAGRILESEGRVEEGGLWRVLSYPALGPKPRYDENDELIPYTDLLEREPDDPLAPSRFSQKWLMEQRRYITPMVWNAEYQQEPTDPEGDYFKVGRFQIESVPPADICRIYTPEGKDQPYPVDIQKGVRYWDLAATEKSMDARDPDYASGTLMSESNEGYFWLLDEVRGRWAPEQVFDMVKQTAKLDGKRVRIVIEQEPGSAGKSLIAGYVRALAGYEVEGRLASGEKTVRAQTYASYVNAGNVFMLKADWNKPFIAEHAGFPNVRHDDQVDSASGAFNEITDEEERWYGIDFVSI